MPFINLILNISSFHPSANHVDENPLKVYLSCRCDWSEFDELDLKNLDKDKLGKYCGDTSKELFWELHKITLINQHNTVRNRVSIGWSIDSH